VTVNLLYSFVRPDKFPNNQMDGSYVPLQLAEKDPIRHKYGAFEGIAPFRDYNTTLLGANQYVWRFDPNKDIVWYIAPGMPDVYKNVLVQAGGIVDKTNDVLTKAGAKGRFKVLNFDDDQTFGDKAAKTPKHFGDVRYSWFFYHADFDSGTGFLGLAQFNPDFQTGQTLTASVNMQVGPFQDTVIQRLDLFLQTVGAELLLPNGEFDDTKYPQTCNDGDTVPLVPADIASKLNAGSTVYGKMQAYLQQPVSVYGNLGPANFLPQHDADFYNAYFALIPYNTYGDPQGNPFVGPEGSTFPAPGAQLWSSLKNVAAFKDLTAQMDHGTTMFDVTTPNSVAPALAFQHQLHDGILNIQEHQKVLARQRGKWAADDLSMYSYFDIYKSVGRRCVGGKWEARKDYTDRLITGLNAYTLWHELGHTLGLRHNFMGSIDQRNFPKDTKGNIAMFSSSVMEYNMRLVESQISNVGAWPPYDAAALGWIYGNNLSTMSAVDPNHPLDPTAQVSGQTSATKPWNDPLGWDAMGKEVPMLYCSDEHLAYTPLCRHFDSGATPSEIMANEIQQREWRYLWTNFRLYHKYFDLGYYGTTTANEFAEYRRFISMWDFDWSPGELLNTLRLIGITPPDGATAGEYYAQLGDKFNEEASIASQLGATYQRAILDQASGERPFKTIFDPFYGDTTQQGILIDKGVAIDGFAALWPAISNYDPSQAGAFLKSSMLGEDAPYNELAKGVVLDFLGAAFATYTYAQIGPIASFAEETHNSLWSSAGGDLNMQDWIGGKLFYRERDFLDYLHAIAVKNEFNVCDENGANCQLCTSLDNCTWDPRVLQTKSQNITQSDRYNRFQGPDGRTYIWMYLPSRNMWLLADKDRNVAMYTLVLAWSTDVVSQEDDGTQGAADLELKVRFAVDAYLTFNNNQTNTP
jgi:hypothetical protein